MNLQLRLGRLLAAAAILALTAAQLTAAPIQRHPVGWERVPHPALPKPLKAANGAVYVPTALKIFPTLPDADFVGDDPADVLGSDLGGLNHGPRPQGVNVVSPNVRANNTAGDAANTTNSETYLAAKGNDIVAAWNDGLNFGVSPGNTGYSYSSDGGLTYTDGGVPPVTGPAARHEGDPCVMVDNAGNFYLSDLYTPDGSASGIAVTRGTFAGTVFTWNTPVIIQQSATDFLDKEWLGVDKANGNVYCTYTRFLAAGGDQLEFTRSTDNGATWSVPLVLTSPANESMQGSRVVVGPKHEVQVMWYTYDVASGNNYIRTCRSTDQGLTFGPTVTLPTGPSGIISNYGSGPAGFNRARGIGFPSMAIDNTPGLNKGHVYATWEETVNFYTDPLGSLGNVAEVENNGTPGTANPILIGQSVSGAMSSTADQDWFSFSGVAGQTAIIYLTPGTGDGFLRVFAGGGAVANRAELSYIGFGTGLCVFTLPSSGTYYIRVLANSATVGTYTLYTGWDTPDPGDEVARDQRDAIFQASNDGITWGPRKVVNDDAPLFDNAFPEVAVDGGGQVYVDWYDHRVDAANGILTDIYYNRSGNGGAAFFPSIKVNDGPSINWNNVGSNLAPNMGDYSGLVSDGCNVYANFADGRQGSADSWVATINDNCVFTAITVAGLQASAGQGYVDLSWSATISGVARFQVYRSTTRNGVYAPVGNEFSADGRTTYAFRDAAVAPGAEYYYKVAYSEGGDWAFTGAFRVQTPQAQFALRAASPNPTAGSSVIQYEIARAGHVTVQVYNLAGAHVRTLLDGPRTAGLGNVTWDGRDDAGRQAGAGAYYVRLSSNGQSRTERVTLLR